MRPTFESLRNEYSHLYQSMEVRNDRLQSIDKIVQRLLANKPRYEAVMQATTVPWFVIAALHEREASGNFKCHLHNGDPLTARTRHVPSGRPPPPTKPPFTWEQSAIDALELDGLSKVENWSVERACYEIELYNGFGYRRHNIHSPYLWSFSNHYSTGKYIADGKWSESALDAQCGVMPLIDRMMAADQSVSFNDSATAGVHAALNKFNATQSLPAESER